jgi:Bacterial conjugation TrbI-like protein
VASDLDRQLDQNSKTNLPPYKKSIFQMAVISACIGMAAILVGSLVFPHEQAKVAADSTPTAAPVAATNDFAPDPKFGVVASKLAMQKQEQDILTVAQAQQQQAAANKANIADPNQANAAAVPKANPADPVKTAATAGGTDNTPPVITNNSDPRFSKGEALPTTEPVYHPPAPIKIPDEPVVSKPVAKKVAIIKPAPVQRPVVIASRQVAAVRPQPQTTASQVPSVLSRSTPVPKINPPNSITVVRPQVTWKEANANATGVWGSRTVSAATPTAPVTALIAQSPTANIPTVSRGKAVVGQQIKGRLISPIQTSATVPTQEIAISLERSIVSTQGKVLVPAGTQIVAQIGILDSGMMSILAAKATIEDREVDIPPRALILQASNRQPLLAELKQFGQDEVGRRDMMAMLGGAVQAIGKNLTEPQTSTVVAAGGIVQNTNTQTNILGAGLNGGFAPVAQQWLDRNQQAIQQINARSKVWYLGTGTEVNLVVAQPFSL